MMTKDKDDKPARQEPEPKAMAGGEEVEAAAEKAEEAVEVAETAAAAAEESAQATEKIAEGVKEVVKKVKDEKPTKSSPKLSAKLDKIMRSIEELSVLELADLVKALQDKFGVAAAPVAQAPVAPTTQPQGGAEAQGPAEEQTTFNVILGNSGANKISVIKALREINPQLGLKEAKDIADSPPKEILTGVNKSTADEAKSKLESAGANVELK